ncbi:helix-turn-helix domain-containing protein [Candidatus Omnitrophota bacterium]
MYLLEISLKPVFGSFLVSFLPLEAVYFKWVRKILELLASRRGQVFTRGRILEYLWGDEKIVVERTVDVHVRNLRKKLGKAGELIKNVRGFGYVLE